MKKQELIDVIAEDAGLSKKAAGAALDALLDNVTGALTRGEEVTLPGFGKFTVTERAARKGRNPQTGEVVDIAASRAPGFKAGKPLKDAVNS